MNNAGVMAIPERKDQHEPTFSLHGRGVLTLRGQETKNGFEEQFGVNHLGHFAACLNWSS